MVCTYKYLHENQYVTYLIHEFSLRASCYRIPNLAAAQSPDRAGRLVWGIGVSEPWERRGCVRKVANVSE